jgi:hypothetical protein
LIAHGPSLSRSSCNENQLQLACNATLNERLIPQERTKEDRAAFRNLEMTMNKTTQMMICLALLGFAFASVPAKANAQSDDDKKFLAMAAQSDQNEIALSQLAE